MPWFTSSTAGSTPLYFIFIEQLELMFPNIGLVENLKIVLNFVYPNCYQPYWLEQVPFIQSDCYAIAILLSMEESQNFS